MRKFLFLICQFFLICCGSPLHNAQETNSSPDISPDYTDITIPANIAPLNFTVNDGDRCLTVISNGESSLKVRGKMVSITQRKWKKLINGGNLSITVYAKTDGKWLKRLPFTMTVAEQTDPFISYRLIAPSYQAYGPISIMQRDLTSFRDKVIYSNTLIGDEQDKQCVNCHHFRNYTTDNMQFHTRQYKGGTILVKDGVLHKINLKTDSTVSAGVYPAWHPTHDFIAYSVNTTTQRFHTAHPNRIEVADLESGLILYDINRNEVSIISDQPDQLECFPAWAPDGHKLYYVSATVNIPDSIDPAIFVYNNYTQIHYDLYSITFNPDTKEWGTPEKIIDAAAINRSITLPRVSPDGRYIMFTMARYGVFHIWHRDSDLYIADLQTRTIRPLKEINSSEVESYHSWSSNGKWVMFASRRTDTNHTRLFLTHLNQDGTFSKPFIMPQKNAYKDSNLLLSYSIPEFSVEPVHINAHRFAKFIRNNNAENVCLNTDKD